MRLIFSCFCFKGRQSYQKAVIFWYDSYRMSQVGVLDYKIPCSRAKTPLGTSQGMFCYFSSLIPHRHMSVKHEGQDKNFRMSTTTTRTGTWASKVPTDSLISLYH